MKNIFKKLVIKNNKSNEVYNAEVVKAVRTKYTPNDEVAILRKTVAAMLVKLNNLGIDTSEFKEFNSYVEEQKKAIKADLGI